MPPQEKLAFTVKYRHRVPELRMDVGVSEPYDPASGDVQPRILGASAIWDTGATTTAVSKKVIQDLGLFATNEIDNHTANGVRKAKIYLANLYLPNGVAVPVMEVIDADIHGCDVLVGMDIIGLGDLAITHKHGHTWMTFQIPPSHATDYVHEVEVENGKKGFRQPRKRRK